MNNDSKNRINANYFEIKHLNNKVTEMEKQIEKINSKVFPEKSCYTCKNRANDKDKFPCSFCKRGTNNNNFEDLWELRSKGE